jgi:hypothetical protein
MLDANEYSRAPVKQFKTNSPCVVLTPAWRLSGTCLHGIDFRHYPERTFKLQAKTATLVDKIHP